MLGALRSAHAEPRSAAARIGLVALLACIGLTWTAGASSAFATYGTVKITKINQGGDQADLFHFDAPSAIKAGGFEISAAGTPYTNAQVHANTGSYASLGDYTVSEPAAASGAANDKYELKSIDCTVDGGYNKPATYGSATQAGTAVKIRVGVHHTVACTFTNKRKTGTITVKKQLEPATDLGKFDLRVDGKDVASQVGNGGYGSATVPTGTHTVDEYGTNLADYVRSTTCVNGTTVVAEGSGALSVPVGANDQITCTVKNVRKAKIVVAKHTAPADTAATKTAFGFSVNPGAIAYSLTDGASDTRVVEPGKAYTITEADAHAKGYKLTAIQCTSGTSNLDTRTATVTPAAGETVTCEFTNTKLQSAIQIVKSGPATATAGALLPYTLDVTTPGETAFAAADVAVTDAKCTAAPALQSTNGDATPGTLNPGDRWTYTCSVQTAAGQTSVVNVADVTGTDELGTVVTDEDSFTTTLTQPTPPSIPTPPSTPVTPQSAPAQQVAGVTATSRTARGTAALRGPRACPTTGTVAATVTGRQIRRVTFFVAGKKVTAVTKADRNGRWTLNIRTGSLRRGTNAVVARVEFTAASRTRTRSLRITITRCAAQAVQPQFTG
jgi:hypothetical protein